jgi:trk system potassium uptake protein TrkH
MYELVSPVNPAALLKYLGNVIFIFGVVLLIPMIAGLALGDLNGAFIFGITGIIVGIVGLILFKILPDHEMQRKEAIALAALTFPVASFIAAFPLGYIGNMPFGDALFESISGLTTTGLSVAPLDASPLFLFTRSWLQWIGGLGIVVLMLSIFLPPGSTAFRLYAVHFGEEKIRPEVTKTAGMLGRIYLILSLIIIAILLLAGMGPFDAICHALSSVSTGGFSTKADSIAAFQGFMVPSAIICSSIIGAISFSLYPLLRTNPKFFFKDPQVRGLFLLAFIGTGFLIITLLDLFPAPITIEDSLFQAVSALTTTGFSTMEIATLPEASKFVISVLMWIGGGVGSTAGGIKILRFIIILKIIHIVFVRFFLPKEAITPLKVGEHVIERDEVYTILTYLFLYIAVLVFSTFILTLSGFPIDNSLFEASSALGTVGLSTGITSAAMPLVPKIILGIDMLLGRIEIIPLCILLMPQTWIER